MASGWHEPVTEWPDEAWRDPASEVSLEVVETGFASVKKLVPELEFVERKKRVGTYLRGSAIGPGNSGKPISDADCDLIIAEMAATKERPAETDGSVLEELTVVSDWKFMSGKIHDLAAPNLRTVDAIITEVKAGRLGVPVFQRKFTWSRRQIEELWESIFQGFFVGSILTWGENKSVEAHPVDGAPDLTDRTEIILDGQQRITSLYKAVVPGDNPDDFLYFVDLKSLLDPRSDMADTVTSYKRQVAGSRGYLDKSTQFEKKLFPISAFSNNHPVWLNEFREYLEREESYTEEEATKYHEQLQAAMNHVWFQFKIPMVQLPGSMNLQKVAEVFGRINSKGTPLGMFDLLNAKFIMRGIKLKVLWKDAQAEFANIRYVAEKTAADSEKLLIQSMCLYKKGSFRREDLFSLDAAYVEAGRFDMDAFELDWKNSCRFLSDAIGKIMSRRGTGFGAIRFSLIPYTITIPIMVAMLHNISTRSDRLKCMGKIEAWYWAAVFSNRYSGSTYTKAEKDFREIKEWFDEDAAVPTMVIQQREKLDRLKFNTSNKNDAVFKAVMCMILKDNPLDLVGDEPPHTHRFNAHRVFPKTKAGQSDAQMDSCLNMVPIADSTWDEYMRDSDPPAYLERMSKEMGNSDNSIEKRLQVYLISDTALERMKNNDYAGFIEARAETIRKKLGDLISPKPGDDDNIDKFLHVSESSTLEYKSSLRWSSRAGKILPELEDEVVIALASFMNAEGGSLLIGVDDGGNPIGLEDDYKTLRKKDSDWFTQQLVNIMRGSMGVLTGQYVDVEFYTIDGKEICLCRAKKSPEPVYAKVGKSKGLYVRINNTSQLLDVEDAVKYIRQHWG